MDCDNRIERSHAQERRATCPGATRGTPCRGVVQPLHESAVPSEALLYELGDHGEAGAMDAGREVVDGTVDCRNSS
jgi:hypothetical protein